MTHWYREQAALLLDCILSLTSPKTARGKGPCPGLLEPSLGASSPTFTAPQWLYRDLRLSSEPSPMGCYQVDIRRMGLNSGVCLIRDFLEPVPLVPGAVGLARVRSHPGHSPQPVWCSTGLHTVARPSLNFHASSLLCLYHSVGLWYPLPQPRDMPAWGAETSGDSGDGCIFTQQGVY